MDETLEPFRRQYLQQILPTNIRYPSPKVLVTEDVQRQIYRHFFDETSVDFLPPPDYQRRVLKKIILEIERELARGSYDADEYAVSDELMSRMGVLSALPAQSESESAQELRTLSYFAPTLPDDDGGGKASRTLIRESPNLLAAGSNVGLRTWEACLRLAYYLCTSSSLAQRHADGRPMKGANVIELGAGTGLLSLICDQVLMADHVVATDGLSHVVGGIRDNIELNASNDTGLEKHSTSISAALLDWTDPTNIDQILDHDGHRQEYDYILGADITYHPELFEPLANVLKLLKTKFPKARILIAATARNESTLRNFRTVCTDGYGFRIREIGEDEWRCPDYVAQTGLFHEQAFPVVIMDIDLM